MELHIPKERKTMNAKEIRDIPQDLLVRLGEEQDMTTEQNCVMQLTNGHTRQKGRSL